MESVLVRRDTVGCVGGSLRRGGGGEVWVLVSEVVEVGWLTGKWGAGDVLCELFFLFCGKGGLGWIS